MAIRLCAQSSKTSELSVSTFPAEVSCVNSLSAKKQPSCSALLGLVYLHFLLVISLFKIVPEWNAGMLPSKCSKSALCHMEECMLAKLNSSGSYHAASYSSGGN